MEKEKQKEEIKKKLFKKFEALCVHEPELSHYVFDDSFELERYRHTLFNLYNDRPMGLSVRDFNMEFASLYMLYDSLELEATEERDFLTDFFLNAYKRQYANVMNTRFKYIVDFEIDSKKVRDAKKLADYIEELRERYYYSHKFYYVFLCDLYTPFYLDFEDLKELYPDIKLIPRISVILEFQVEAEKKATEEIMEAKMLYGMHPEADQILDKIIALMKKYTD